METPTLNPETQTSIALFSIQPARTSLLDIDRLAKLETIFIDGGQKELDPIVILNASDSEELLLYDGNHRLALAVKYHIPIRYKVYRIGDVHYDCRGMVEINEHA